MLYSFRSERQYVDPTEVIDLRVYSSVKSSDRTVKGNSFELYSPEHSFSLIAETEGQKEDWIRSLGRAIVMSHSGSHVNDQGGDEEEEDEDEEENAY